MKRLVGIDALRGVAALCVVFFHAREINWVGTSEVWRRFGLSLNPNALFSYATFPFTLGFAAVSLFFVVSGYCIHRPHASKLAADERYTLDLREYCKRRLWRIYPVLLAALLLTLALDWGTRTLAPSDPKLGDTSARAFFVNLLSLQNLAGRTYGSNVSLWTLAVELHLYALYPVVFGLTRRVGPVWTCAGIFALSMGSVAVLRLTQTDLKIFAPFWFTWMVGFFVAEHEVGRARVSLRRAKPLIVAATLIACALGFRNQRDLAEPFFALAFGALLWWSIARERRAMQPYRVWVWLARVGVFSYSLYAVHYPLLVFLRAWLQNGRKGTLILVPFAFTLLCVAFAVLLFWAVERWSLRLPVIVRRAESRA